MIHDSILLCCGCNPLTLCLILDRRLDAVVVPIDVEARIETYINIFRPVLVAGRAEDDSGPNEDASDIDAGANAVGGGGGGGSGGGSGSAPEWLFVGRTGQRYTRLSEDVQRVIRRHAGAHLNVNITCLRKALQLRSTSCHWMRPA